MLMLCCLAAAGAAGLLGWTIVDIMTCPRTTDPAEGRFEVDRRQQLRSANAIYRNAEPLIDEWNHHWPIKAKKVTETEDNLRGAGIRLPWKAAEFLNVKRIESILIGGSMFLISMMVLGNGVVTSLVLALVGFFGYQWASLRTLKSQSIVRQMTMKRKFAGAIDLMALMMEVGAGFEDCLEVAVQESKHTPLGEELGLVKKEISLGALRSKALTGLAERTADADMNEVIMSINEGEELGTPLTSILRNQADQMRQKRSQWAEKAAEESQVAIVFPAMLIMVACLLIVVAPFVLTVISGGGL